MRIQRKIPETRKTRDFVPRCPWAMSNAASHPNHTRINTPEMTNETRKRNISKPTPIRKGKRTGFEIGEWYGICLFSFLYPVYRNFSRRYLTSSSSRIAYHRNRRKQKRKNSHLVDSIRFDYFSTRGVLSIFYFPYH